MDIDNDPFAVPSTDGTPAEGTAAPATQSTEAPIVEHDDQILYGSSTLPATFVIDGETVALGTIVAAAFSASGLTEDEWNALSDEDRDAKLDAELAKRGYVAPGQEAPADLVVSRSADAPAPGQFDPVKPVALDQRTGFPAEAYRAPSMTRESSISLLEARYGELVMQLRDFDHDTDGLPADLVALIDFVKSRQA